MLKNNLFRAFLSSKRLPWLVLGLVAAIIIGAGFATSSGAHLPVAAPYTPKSAIHHP
ncbi:MAG TPA: hypothetical protein P5149_04680 [Candidatus Competibacteraceae bacterium]|nr:hypothetical protein [Candidatus Competibacteraceae bacterium]MCP5133204.1 hypothetical protein [Gammaproteobacteria bacterium]HPF57952.1 hypothetical protein [Candidatus Competibacteraceae bacterium]HRY17680.1 hypothetical protein [Candidatus Competibacteraceae bacterium]